jgi:hypothetical protein
MSGTQGESPGADGPAPLRPAGADRHGGPPLDVAAVDAEGRRLLIGTAHVLAGLMTMGLLDHAGGVSGLYEALFPDLPPGRDRDRAMFTAGAVTGAAGTWRKARSKWQPDGLADVADELYAAGWEAMGGLAHDAATVAPAWWAAWTGPEPLPGTGESG